ncbi:MAG: dihydroxyacetone kinase subunit L [Spirochaetes bacterium]|uniref:Dihydroxyacetone kinase subunit L n=1 Tax=Candidatus Ornithospirochaeta stercoripullorum TaxID=2840899 RepID=A0A9D9E0S7_9SPIO|nr:dihydroxyacetone kinase subunit L [Candidatus Ornithospirochaeta stercoripullorum]
MTEIAINDLPSFFQSVADEFTKRKDELCEMDANMGDGDLGLTMSKGFSALPDIIKANSTDDLGMTLVKSGMKMASVVPSTMGTLMSSGVMTGGMALKGKTVLDASSLVLFIRGFADGIQKRGKCKRGDRTILDAMASAADKAEAAISADPQATMKAIIDKAVEGAAEGVEATKEMTPVFGKAAVFAAKAKGVPDQGATAALYMLKGMQDYISK